MSCVLQASWIWAGEEDDGQGSNRTGWHIIEVEPHTCRSTGAASGKGQNVTGKGGKGKGRGAPDRSRGMRKTDYSNSQLARVVRAVVLQHLGLDRTKLGTLKTELAKYVQRAVTTSDAVRVRAKCVEMLYGESRAGAARLPAIAAEMVKLGYFAQVHYATKVQMINFTIAGLSSQHAQAQRGLKKPERTVFKKEEVLLCMCM